MLKSWIAALLGLLGVVAAIPAAAEPAVLRGKAVFLEPLESARIAIFALDDGAGGEGRLLQTERLRDLHNGVFAITLGDGAASALAAGQDLRLLVDGNQPTGLAAPRVHRVRLAADLHEFDPNLQVVRVDLYSTLVSTYRRSHRGMPFEEARGNVHAALGAPDSAGGLCAPAFSTAYFDPGLFTTRAVALVGEQSSATTAIGRLNRVLVAAIDRGEFLALGRGRPDLLGDAGTDLAEELAITLLKSAATKAGGEAAGWVIDTVFGAPDATAEQLAEIESQLTVISQQLTQISAQLDALSHQLAEAEAAIINEVDFQA